MPLFSTYITLLLDKLFVGFVKLAENYTNQCAVKDGLVVKLDTADHSRALGTFYNVIKEIKKFMSITTRLILILAGGLFYATVTFCFFCFLWCPKVLYLKYCIIYHTSKVHTSSQKRGISPPQNKDQAGLHPPIFISRRESAWGDTVPSFGVVN